MKIAVICDLHLPNIKTAMQYDILQWAIDSIKEENVDLTVIAGDMTSVGGMEELLYVKNALKDIPHIFLLGNSDVRDATSKDEIILKYSNSKRGLAKDYQIFCINSPTINLDEDNIKLLESINDGAIIITHHNLEAFSEKTQSFLKKMLYNHNIFMIHGHKHFDCEINYGRSTIVGIRGLDPDKVFGLPCISIFDFSDTEYFKYNIEYPLDISKLYNFKDYLGISCYNMDDFLDYAIDNKINNIEVRLRELPANINYINQRIQKWRSNGGRYLSCHLPDLKVQNGRVTGSNEWYDMLSMATYIGVDGLTIHVPKASYREMIPNGTLWREFSNIMYKGLKTVPSHVKIGIENLHLSPGMKNDENKAFGCTPEEVIMWINELNLKLGKNRVGATFDIGHASNNGILSSFYTRSVWYEMIGSLCNAYHIHQVKKTDGKLVNHKAIDNWYGMNINYVSFFMAWSKKHINHAPMFLEMSTIENCQKSIKALEDFFASETKG